VQQGRHPDLTLLFAASPATAAARRSAAREPDRFESQDLAFFERVSAGYAQRVAQAPQRYALLDAECEKAAVWAQIEAAVQARGWW
jgi:dTMP kinase